MATNQQIMDKLDIMSKKLDTISKKMDRVERTMKQEINQLERKFVKLQDTITGQESSIALLSRIDAYTAYIASLNTYNTAVKYDPSNNAAILYDCACLLANTANQLSNINENTDIIDNDSEVSINPMGFFELMVGMLTTINDNGDKIKVVHPIDISVLKTSTKVGLQEPSDYFINNILVNIDPVKSLSEVDKDGCF